MKVIVTGATGFIGRHLVERLLADGEEVIATGRNESVGAELARLGAEFRPADITHEQSLLAAFSPADSVVHCAGRPGDWGAYREFHRDNVWGTEVVARACLKHSIPRCVFLSTPSVYYNGQDRLYVREDEPLPTRQTAFYGRTKLLAEAHLFGLRDRGLSTISFRPRAVYGPYDTTILPRILRMAARRRFPLINGGRALADVTYVENLVDAVIAALGAPEGAWNEVYNISNGSPISIKDWFAQVLEVFERPFRPLDIPEPLAWAVAAITEAASRTPFGPTKPNMTRFSVGYMARSLTMSIEKAGRKLGFQPRFSNQDGFTRSAAAWRDSDQLHDLEGR